MNLSKKYNISVSQIYAIQHNKRRHHIFNKYFLNPVKCGNILSKKEIKEIFYNPLKHKKIAIKYGISASLVSHIKLGTRYKKILLNEGLINETKTTRKN